MANNNNPLASTFETINNATGGVAGQVAQGLKSAATAATVDVAKGVAKAPVDVIRDILGDDSDSEPAEAGASGSGGGSSDDDATDSAALMQKIEEDRRKVAARLTQHRMVIAEEREQYEKSKQEAQIEKREEIQEDQQKAEIKQLELRKKQQSIAVTNAMQGGGSHEMGGKSKM